MKNKEKSFFEKFGEYKFFQGMIALIIFVVIIIYVLIENLLS
jgi:hypothetical protein